MISAVFGRLRQVPYYVTYVNSTIMCRSRRWERKSRKSHVIAFSYHEYPFSSLGNSKVLGVEGSAMNPVAKRHRARECVFENLTSSLTSYAGNVFHKKPLRPHFMDQVNKLVNQAISFV